MTNKENGKNKYIESYVVKEKIKIKIKFIAQHRIIF